MKYRRCLLQTSENLITLCGIHSQPSAIWGHILVARVACWFWKVHWSWWLCCLETIHIFADKVQFGSKSCRNGLRAERKGNSGVLYDWRKVKVKTPSAKYLWTKICYCCSWGWWWWWWWYILRWSVCVCVCHKKSSLPTSELSTAKWVARLALPAVGRLWPIDDDVDDDDGDRDQTNPVSLNIELLTATLYVTAGSPPGSRSWLKSNIKIVFLKFWHCLREAVIYVLAEFVR